jgi:hypothetical protein
MRRVSSKSPRVGAAVRRDTTLMQSDVPRRIEVRRAPPKQAERQHARPGAGIKRARAAMLPKPS